MPLSLALVFHFNQHTHEYAAVASRACYRGLLNVLRAHPKLKFNLHISGTLLRALNWLDPDVLAAIQDGVKAGQFELLGSTYAQNVPYASDDWDNAQQLALHRRLIEEKFGVQPKVFWNSERSWRQTLVPVIAQAGYTATLVEDHILEAAGLDQPVPVTTTLGDDALTVICDDIEFRERFNYAAWFGRRAQLFNYLKGIAHRRGAKHFWLAYAEDAEAMGLWNWERGYLPHAAWAHLDKLLKELEGTDVLALKHLSKARPRQTIAPLPDAAGQWMDRALLDPKAPYHEEGYADWFDFLERSPKMNYFRRLYSVMRTSLQIRDAAQVPVAADGGDAAPEIARADGSAAAETFYRQGLETFCHHQYEFGCIGVGGVKYWGWENVRTTLLFTRVAELAENPPVRHWIEDVNGDGSDEQLLCDGRYLAVLTAYGGRLLYWFDLIEGRQWVGNHLSVPSAEFEPGVTKQPQPALQPKVWLPDTFDANLKPWKSLRRKEAAPTRLGHRLADWVFQHGPSELTVYRRRIRRPGLRPPLRAQIGALNHRAQLDDQAESEPSPFLDYRFEPSGPCYLHFISPRLRIEKRIRQLPDGLAVRFTVRNRRRTAHQLRLALTNELCPDYAEVLRGGRPALDFVMHDDVNPGIVNTATGMAIVTETSREWHRLERNVNLLALELGLTFELDVPPHSAQDLEIQIILREL